MNAARKTTAEEYEHMFELSALRGRLVKCKKGDELKASFILEKIAAHEKALVALRD